MIDAYYDRLYLGLKEFVGERSIYSPYILKKPKESVFPLVVFTLSDTQAIDNLGYYDQTALVDFTVEISSTNLEFNGEEVDGMEISREIRRLTEEFLGVRCGLQKTYDSPAPNVDTNVYRILMNFTTRINTTRNIKY